MESRIDKNDDLELVFQIREDNDDAKDYLYSKYSALIHKEINAFKNRANTLGIDFQDLTQEAMLGFSDAINHFKEDGESKFITFATICIRRQLSNYVAKFDNSKSKMFVDSVALDAKVGKGEGVRLIDQIQSTITSDPLKKLINSETLKETGARMNTLSDNEKLALAYDLEGKSVEEIAKITGLTNKQIYNLIFRARKKLKL